MPIINIQRIGLSGRAVIDQFGHVSIESALAHLSRVGLAEAHCYLLPPGRLSDGQRWRLRIAMALSRESDRRCCLICDEFASLLDSITAAVVARVLRRAVSASPKLCAIVASSRGDIANALSADVIIRCDFGKVEVWKKAKGGGYVHAGEISRAPGLCARAVDFAGRDAG